MDRADNKSVETAACNGGGFKGRVHLADHPLIRTKLSIIRDRRTEPKRFRELVYEIGLYVGFQATACLATTAEENVLPPATTASLLTLDAWQ